MLISHTDLLIVLNGFKLGKSLREQELVPLWDPSTSSGAHSFWNMQICGSVSVDIAPGLFIYNANSKERNFIGSAWIRSINWANQSWDEERP